MASKLLWGQRGCALLFRSLIYDTYLPCNSRDTLLLVPEYYLCFLGYSIYNFKSIKWSAGLILPLTLLYLWSPLSVKACHRAPPYYSLRHHRGALDFSGWRYRSPRRCARVPLSPWWPLTGASSGRGKVLQLFLKLFLSRGPAGMWGDGGGKGNVDGALIFSTWAAQLVQLAAAAAAQVAHATSCNLSPVGGQSSLLH